MAYIHIGESARPALWHLDWIEETGPVRSGGAREASGGWPGGRDLPCDGWPGRACQDVPCRRECLGRSPPDTVRTDTMVDERSHFPIDASHLIVGCYG